MKFQFTEFVQAKWPPGKVVKFLCKSSSYIVKIQLSVCPNLDYKMTPRPITALQNDPPAYNSLAKWPPAYNSLWLLDSIYKMTPQPILALQNDPLAYNSLAKWPPGLW